MSVTLSKKNLLTAEGLTNTAIADSKLIDEMVECTEDQEQNHHHTL